MKFDKLIQQLEILIYIFKNKKVELRTLSTEFNLSYQTIHFLIEKWRKEGYIEKNRKEILILGGDKYEYRLNEQSRKLIINLINRLKILKTD